MCRNEQDTQFGRLDPSIAPGEAEARKPKSLATEGQAQQQHVNQQGEQQRKRESPVFIAQALTQRLSASCGSRSSLRLRGR
jgi:hypothetical protein